MRIAVVLFNLGGPDSLAAVRPFLFNLFNDPAIIGLPGPLRWLVAKLISNRRAPVAREIYNQLGGKSPLLELTKAQATSLESRFTNTDDVVRVFVCMRYWHPMSDEVAADVATFQPDRIILLPLYPQFSTTTTESSVKDWHHACAKRHLTVATTEICCYPEEPGLARAQAELIRPRLEKAAAHGRPRILFSAHGLPEKVIAAGDPYQWQVERTAAAVLRELAIEDLDHVVCYQSRVGPLKWIGPSTDHEIARAGAEGVPLVVVPIAFVSEHSETLVELDMEYRHLAEEKGVPAYERVPAVGTETNFIDGLAELVGNAVDQAATKTISGARARICPQTFGRCVCAATARER